MTTKPTIRRSGSSCRRCRGLIRRCGARVGRILGEWQSVLEPAFRAGLRELGVDTRRYPVEAVVSLVVTFNEGVILERLMGVDSGHAQLLEHDRPPVGADAARAARRDRHDESSLSRRRRFRRARRREDRIRGVRRAERRRCCSCRPGRSSTRRFWKLQVSVPRPPLPRRHLRRSRQRPFGSAARSGRVRSRVRSRSTRSR